MIFISMSSVNAHILVFSQAVIGSEETESLLEADLIWMLAGQI
ncbi:hypothetical protein [Cohaesibacter sp. ES.047]|nr:hypothetical protein [Cohaesibacter sp. ES.047]